MHISTLAKYVWASPVSAVGACLTCVAALVGAKYKAVNGVLEVSLVPRSAALARAVHHLPFAAITLGHFVVACSQFEQDLLRVHERVHVAQYERWGPCFLLAYPLESLLQLLLGRRPYLDNRFEVAARAAASMASFAGVAGEA